MIFNMEGSQTHQFLLSKVTSLKLLTHPGQIAMEAIGWSDFHKRGSIIFSRYAQVGGSIIESLWRASLCHSLDQASLLLVLVHIHAIIAKVGHKCSTTNHIIMGECGGWVGAICERI
jgi:hypothetical protein